MQQANSTERVRIITETKKTSNNFLSKMQILLTNHIIITQVLCTLKWNMGAKRSQRQPCYVRKSWSWNFSQKPWFSAATNTAPNLTLLINSNFSLKVYLENYMDNNFTTMSSLLVVMLLTACLSVFFFLASLWLVSPTVGRTCHKVNDKAHTFRGKIWLVNFTVTWN